MINQSQRLIIIVVLWIPNFIQQANGQQDSTLDFSDYGSHYGSDLIEGLPVVHVDDIYELNPLIFNTYNSGAFQPNGLNRPDDYTWFDEIPVRFAEEMPIRLISITQFNSFIDYLNHGNSVAGFCSFIPVSAPDSFSFRIESITTLVHKLPNDADIQLILSGPIRFNKSGGKKGISVSYLLASRLFSSADANPSFISRDHAPDEYLDYLYNNPLRPAAEGVGTYENALYTEASDAVRTFFNSNAATKGYSIYGNLKSDFQNGMSIKLGTYAVSKNEVIPIYENYFFNQEHNPEKSTRYSNNYLRFEQQLNASKSVRIHYQLTGQYTYLNTGNQDPDHGKDFFSYGYVGKFNTHKTPTFQIGSDTVNGNFYGQAWVLNSWDYDTLVEFTPGNLNPGLAAYTSSYYSIFEDEPYQHYQNKDQIILGGGLINGVRPDMVYGLWNNAGTVYNEYSEQDQRQVNVFASGDLVIGKHKIILGFQFNRDSYSSYQVHPNGLWSLMRGITNFHIRELDFGQPYVHEGDLMDTIYYSRKFDAISQQAFDKNLRETLGLDPEGLDFIDIDSYDFNTNSINYFDKDGIKHTINCGQELFSIDMFTADELLNDGIASYVESNGFDYSGNRIRNKVSFNDFFTAKNDQGEYTRQAGAYIPMKYSACADYQLNLKGWSINAGFRIDVFNANQQVVEDPYLFYKAYTVGDLAANATFSYTIPSGISNDFVVYVDNVNHPTEIVGFRYGDLWYDYEGTPVTNPERLDVGSGISPYIIHPEQEYITIDVFTRNKIYFNFLPQLSIQKKLKNRLLLTFVYNSAIQNPAPEITFSNPAAYYFIGNASGYLPNGSLEPERTDKFRTGVTVLPFPGIVISAEGYLDYFTNVIYPVYRNGAYPKNYYSYDNAEDPFIQYGVDLRVSHKSGKISGFNYGINYHLLINDDKTPQKQLDFLMPRNMVKGYLQFNTGYGNDYIGPSGSGSYAVFESIGLGWYGYYHSRVPFKMTYHSIVTNSTAYIPAMAFLDIKIEKGFHFQNDRYMLNLYCVIQNLFNSRTIYKVYRSTGEPDDDGYLSDPASQKQISEALSEESYRYLYGSFINNPENYGLPRRTTLGISFNF